MSHFPGFLVFLTIFHVLPCAFLIFLVCHFSRHLPGPTVCLFHFTRFSVFSPYSRSYHDFLSFLACQFSRHIQVPTVCVFHFALFSVFLAICNVLPCEFLIFLICKFSHHTPYPTVCISHFPRFSVGFFLPYFMS